MKATEDLVIQSWFIPTEEHKKLKLIALQNESTMTNYLLEYLDIGNKTYMNQPIDLKLYIPYLKIDKYKKILIAFDKENNKIAKKIALQNDITLRDLLKIYVIDGNKRNI